MIDVCIHITTHIVKNGLSVSFNQECVIILVIIIFMTAFFTFNIVHVKLVVILLCIALYLRLPEDGNLSLKHVGDLCLWITYNFIVCVCWYM